MLVNNVKKIVIKNFIIYKKYKKLLSCGGNYSASNLWSSRDTPSTRFTTRRDYRIASAS